MNNPLCAMATLLLGIAMALHVAAVGAANGDEHIVAARDAYRAGDRARLAAQLEAARGHELGSYVEGWLLQLRLAKDEPADQGVADFLARQPDSIVAERVRSDWLKQLGKRRQWDLFQREYPALRQPDVELVCYSLQGRLAAGDLPALEEARPYWFSELELPAPCLPMMESLIAYDRLSLNDVWERVRRTLEMKRLGQARTAAGFLPDDQVPESKLLERIADAPQRHLDKLKPNFAVTRLGREMAMYAVQRLARSDPQRAAAEWESIKSRFSPAERGYVYGQLGFQGALKHAPEAIAWYKAAGDAPLSDEQLQWKVRAALRGRDWKLVRATIENMPGRLAEKAEWQYWLGRADRAAGRSEEARELFERIGGQPNFYSNLADDELGRPITVPPKAARASKEEVAQIAAQPAIRRALALFRVDLRQEAVREWNWALRGMDDRRLLAAAELAHRNEIFDRAISSADRTQAEHDYDLRYLAPFREVVEPAARELQLDAGWVYGLMRQESRFVMNARSSAGAQGLMQLMPGTARYVAKKIGLKDFHPARVTDMDINVALGTNYLKMVLDNLDNHPVLASAAYNAGPGRARKWRDAKHLEGAIYIETIPFNETRDYVKKVMSNAVYYSIQFEGRGPSLKQRLGVISPRNGDGETANGGGDDLP
jgi:soluble lytic murein transglycosylase